MKLHLSGDLHLSHANILRYCNRPWLRKSDLNASGNWKNKEIALERVLQMNKDLIKGFNSVLKEDDFCIHVGDYCFRNSPGGKAGEGEPNTAYNYIKQFKGIWTFIKGNHDGNNSLKTKITSLVIRFGQLSYYIVHDPRDANFNYEVNLVGHVHNAWKIREVTKGNKTTILYNVGVDVQQFRPVSMEKIVADITKWRKS